MKQSRLMSFLKTTLSTFIGLVVALTTQLLVFPLFGFHPSLPENLIITAIFTVVSIARQFVVRRLFEALHIRRPLSPFVQAPIAERFRQIEVEGFDASHDDDLKTGELAAAGATYAFNQWLPRNDATGMPLWWPWSMDWWKPEGGRRDLVKAAALILAEGERFDRQRKKRNA